MEVPNPRKFTRHASRETFTLPIGRGGETAPYAFQWLLYRPQAHAIEPFVTRQAARDINTARPTQPGPTGTQG
jgi:hypothetical protein